MGRRRRRIIRTIKRTLPKVFSCPRCGMSSLRVALKEEIGRVVCANCHVESLVTSDMPACTCTGQGAWHTHLSGREEYVDIYNKFVDQFYVQKIP